MNGVAFYIGVIPIPWYGILVVAGMLLASLFSYYEWRKRGNDRTVFWWLFWVVVLSGYFGSRWFYLIFNPSDINGWYSFISISTGRSIIGGIVFSVSITSLIISLFNIPIDKRELYSVVLPNMLLAQAIGRWGNFANQELYGNAVSSLDWAPNFIKEGMLIDVNGVESYYQPLFLYESIADIIGWLLITFIAKNSKKLKVGTHGSLYFIWYGATRASIELFRDSTYIMKINGFPTSFFWALIFLAYGIVSFVIYQWQYDKFSFYLNVIIPLSLKKNYDTFKSSIMYLLTRKISYYIHMKDSIILYENEMHSKLPLKGIYTALYDGDNYSK
ncbi:MAG: prolipoprotein diacylglyceryl transferase [Mycoplasmataceae bacterium]|nr:prolipoprotein diacylglyceryl transferase [Mycoplasmataceae bacterium]